GRHRLDPPPREQRSDDALHSGARQAHLLGDGCKAQPLWVPAQGAQYLPGPGDDLNPRGLPLFRIVLLTHSLLRDRLPSPGLTVLYSPSDIPDDNPLDHVSPPAYQLT